MVYNLILFQNYLFLLEYKISTFLFFLSECKAGQISSGIVDPLLFRSILSAMSFKPWSILWLYWLPALLYREILSFYWPYATVLSILAYCTLYTGCQTGYGIFLYWKYLIFELDQYGTYTPTDLLPLLIWLDVVGTRFMLLTVLSWPFNLPLFLLAFNH